MRHSWGATFPVDADHFRATLTSNAVKIGYLLIVALLTSLVAVPGSGSTTTSSKETSTTQKNKTSEKKSKTTKSSKAKHSTVRKTTGKTKKRSSKKRPRKRVDVRRLRRMHRAFVASADLKPMAGQLLEARTKPAYAGVEAYARRHAGKDEGAMADLVLGYAHILDQGYLEAIPWLKKAHVKSTDLGDYTDFFLATAYNGTGRSDLVVATLQGFAGKYPESLFQHDATLLYANALIATNHPRTALEALNTLHPEGSETLIGKARAYLKLREPDKAAPLLNRIYYTMPLSDEAPEAQADLDSLLAAGSISQPNFADQKLRARLLARAGHWGDAAREFKALLVDAPEAEKSDIQVELGMALHQSGKDRDAHDVLDSMPDLPGETGAERLLALAEMARSAEDEAGFKNAVDLLRQNHTSSTYFERALLHGGNMYLLKGDFDRAIDYYRELQQRFPTRGVAPYAHWKAAWLTLRQNRNEDAAKLFEEQIEWYPTSPEVSGALYWRARLAEEGHDTAKARAWYQKLASSFHNYYYAELARVRLAQLGTGPITSDPVLSKVIEPDIPGNITEDPPSDDERIEKARLLENAGMTDFSVRELRAVGDEGNRGWANREIARVYRDSGRYDRALRTLKQAVPSYYALDIPSLPRDYWETLFPRAYWEDLQKFSVENGLDPFLVASLVRQESEFNPGAISRASALGLMQLLPSTGRKVARSIHVRFQVDHLLTPVTNLRLGTRYFKDLLDYYNGQVEYALAAYNAGTNRVDAWRANGTYRDMPEFVESIPFTETRQYVQAILRNAVIYRQLYGSQAKTDAASVKSAGNGSHANRSR